MTEGMHEGCHGRYWVKFVARCLRDLNRYSTGCNAIQYVRKSRMRGPPAQHGLQAARNYEKRKKLQAPSGRVGPRAPSRKLDR